MFGVPGEEYWHINLLRENGEVPVTRGHHLSSEAIREAGKL
jgi:hypothetical protein